MKSIIIILVIAIIVLLCIVFSMNRQIKDLKSSTSEAKSEENLLELEKAVDKLISVRNKLEVVEKLQYGHRCKEELMKVIKDLFFFGGLKDPAERATYFARKAENYRDRTWDEAENLELAKMYDILASYAKHHINHLNNQE